MDLHTRSVRDESARFWVHTGHRWSGADMPARITTANTGVRVRIDVCGTDDGRNSSVVSGGGNSGRTRCSMINSASIAGRLLTVMTNGVVFVVAD